MDWDSEKLYAKAKLFTSRAFEARDEDEVFGLWAAMVIELLLRSVIASTSPCLLAEPDPEHTNTLYALGKKHNKSSKSIATNKLYPLANHLIEDYTSEDTKTIMSLVNNRNAELHSGRAAFLGYHSRSWFVNYLKTTKKLTKALDYSLSDFIGSHYAIEAETLMEENRENLKKSVESDIASHGKVFSKKTPEKKEAAKASANTQAIDASHNGCHKEKCPACESTGYLEGKSFGDMRESIDNGDVVVTTIMLPQAFYCAACELNILGYAKLKAVGLNSTYTRTEKYSYVEYYGLTDDEREALRTEFEEPYYDYSNE